MPVTYITDPNEPCGRCHGTGEERWTEFTHTGVKKFSDRCDLCGGSGVLSVRVTTPAKEAVA